MSYATNNVKPDQSLNKLLPVWKENPSAFFEDWELVQCRSESRADDGIGTRFLYKISQTERFASNRISNSIRMIFNHLLFRDIFFLVYAPYETTSLLPRGRELSNFITKAYNILTRKELESDTKGKLSEWVKCGQRYHRIGAKLGNGCFFYAPDFFVK